MKYKLIEIGAGWVVESDDEDTGSNYYKYYDFDDNIWFITLNDDSFVSYEQALQKYNELIEEGD